MRVLRIVCLLVFVFGCKPGRPNHVTLSPGTELGKVDRRLEEASGLVASINNPGFLWTVNDGGNPAEVFLIDQHATIRLVCKLANIENRDWEDISIDHGADGKNYLYIADIGDNSSKYEFKLIYRFEEPVITDEQEKTITQVSTFVFRMPDGERDAETLLIDPTTHDLFIVSKREDFVSLYRAPNPPSIDTMVFKKVLTMPFHEIVAGSISPDGRRVLLKNYYKIYSWEKSANESLVQLLATAPIELPYEHEQQGEAIAWSRNGAEFYTLSESTWRKRASLIVYGRKDEMSIR